MSLALGPLLRIRKRLDHPDTPLGVDRERDRLHEVGLGSDDRHAKAFRHGHLVCGGLGGQPGLLDWIRRQDLRHARVRWDVGPRVVQAQIVEVHVPPAAGDLVDDTDLDQIAAAIAQIDDNAAHDLAVRAGGPKEGLLLPGARELDARTGMVASTDQKAQPRRVDAEGGGDQSAGRAVLDQLVATDPVVALQPACPASPLVHRVAEDRLSGEGVAFRAPIREIPALEPQVELASIGSLGKAATLALEEDEGALLVSHDHVDALIAVHVADGDLRADTGVVVDRVRDEFHFDRAAFSLPSNELEPHQVGRVPSAGRSRGAVGPEALAGDDIEETVAVDIDLRQGMQLGDRPAACVRLRRIVHDAVLGECAGRRLLEPGESPKHGR